MNQKEARANIRRALSLMKTRIKFPRISFREMLDSEDLRAVFKEFVSAKLQRMVANQ